MVGEANELPLDDVCGERLVVFTERCDVSGEPDDSISEGAKYVAEKGEADATDPEVLVAVNDGRDAPAGLAEGSPEDGVLVGKTVSGGDEALLVLAGDAGG